MAKGYMYILECSNGSYYTGSTKYLDHRIQQHQSGEGANHTKKHGPVKLLYFEEFDRIDHAFDREKQVQRWSRKKKKALIDGDFKKLHFEAECKNETHHGGFDSAQPPREDFAQPPCVDSAQPPCVDSAQPPRVDSAQPSCDDSAQPSCDDSNKNI